MPDIILPFINESDNPLPAYESAGAAGMDLRAHLPQGPLILSPGERLLVPTGLRMALPAGYEAQIRPRSGLALKYGVTVLNSPGTIDSDYRGEVQILLINLGQQDFTLAHGMRVAQMVVAPVTRVRAVSAEQLDETRRGSGGFGSTLV